MYKAGQADAKDSLTSSAEVLQGVNPAAETVVTSAAETKSVSSTNRQVRLQPNNQIQK